MLCPHVCARSAVPAINPAAGPPLFGEGDDLPLTIDHQPGKRKAAKAKLADPAQQVDLGLLGFFPIIKILDALTANAGFLSRLLGIFHESPFIQFFQTFKASLAPDF